MKNKISEIEFKKILKLYKESKWMLDEQTIKYVENHLNEQEKIKKILEKNIGTKLKLKIPNPEETSKLLKEHFKN